MRPSPACWSDGPSRTCRSKASASAAGCDRFRLSALAIAAPIAGAAALARRCRRPAFAQIIGPRPERVRDPLALTLGVLADRADVLAVQSALALSFDPRYRDFPFAPLTAAALPFLLLTSGCARCGRRAAARGNGGGCGAGARARSSSSGTRRSPTGRRCGLPRRWRCLRSACFGHGPRQAEDQQRHGERRQRVL